MGGKKRKNNKVPRFDRNKIVGPLTEFERVENPEGANEMGIIATFENNRYGVFLKITTSPGFATQGPDGRPIPMEIVHMIIIRHDKKKQEIPWEEKQFIKTSILGEKTEGMELFPSEERRMSTIVDHQTHLWVLPPGSMIPVGLMPKAMRALAQKNALDKFEVTSEELELYTVEDGDVLQVFASEVEARESYGKVGNEMPEGAVVRIGDAPWEEDKIVWSESAKVKVSAVLSKAETLGNLTNSKDEPEIRKETRVDTNGPRTDQDDLEDVHEVGDFAPNSDEENVMMPEYMELGVDQMKVEREQTVLSSVAKLVEWMESKKVDEVQEAEDEAKAGDDLDVMREKARQERSKKG